MNIHPTNLDKECGWCAAPAEYLLAADNGPQYGCRACVKAYAIGGKDYFADEDNDDGPEREPQWTVATETGGKPIDGMVCTFKDDSVRGYCAAKAAVFVLMDGRWEGDCLCHEHIVAGFSPLKLHGAAAMKERGRW